MNNSMFNIEKYKAEDAEGVKSLILSIVETELRDIPPASYMEDLDNVNFSYSGDRDGFWVAKSGKEIIGTIAVKEDGLDAMIRRFFVNPNFRSYGVGRKLVDTAIVFSKELEYRNIYFVGNSQLHKARNAMIKYGFQETEEISLGDISIFKLLYKI